MVKVHMILTMILDIQPDLDIPLDLHLVSQVLKKSHQMKDFFVIFFKLQEVARKAVMVTNLSTKMEIHPYYLTLWPFQ